MYRISALSTFAVMLLGPRSALAQESVQDFQLAGSAALVSKECIRLTPDQPYASGSAWFKKPIDLARPFEMQMSVVLGVKDEEGADGIVFVFHPSMQTGFRGEGMGFAGLVPSLGIELDTYRNVHLDDPAADHLALMTNGRRAHGPGALDPVALPNLEDGGRHQLRITWTPSPGELRVYLDQALQATYAADLVTSVFGGNSVVFWGMTAGTGRLSNIQDVCIGSLLLGRRPQGPAPRS